MLFTEGRPFGLIPLPIGAGQQYVDVWSDPVEGIRKLDVGTTVIGGAGAHHRLSREDNEYQSAGSTHFSKPGETLRDHFPLYTAWRLEAMDVSNVERATVRYNKIRYGKRYHVFQIRIKRFNEAAETCYGITEEEYRQAYMRAKGAKEQPPASIERVFEPSAAPNSSVALLGFCGKHGDSVDEVTFVFTGTGEASRLDELEGQQRKRTDRVAFDCFISHAGPDKPFAQALHRDLASLGIRAFLDKVDLQPSDQADEVMLKAANKAPIGIAVFSPAYFKRKWPMIELRILVKRGILLPVNFRFCNHEEFVQSLRSSPHAHPSKGEWEDFARSVERTTYIPHEQMYTGRLQQELCWHVVRLLINKTIPSLNNSVASALFMDRLQAAAGRMLDKESFPDLTAKEIGSVKDWVGQIQLRRDQLQGAE